MANGIDVLFDSYIVRVPWRRREPTRVGGRRDWQNVRRRERRVRGGGRWLVGVVIRGAKIKNVSIFRVVALLTIFTSFIVKNKSSRDIDEFNGF